jgi:hypothetical protein
MRIQISSVSNIGKIPKFIAYAAYRPKHKSTKRTTIVTNDKIFPTVGGKNIYCRMHARTRPPSIGLTGIKLYTDCMKAHIANLGKIGEKNVNKNPPQGPAKAHNSSFQGSISGIGIRTAFVER